MESAHLAHAGVQKKFQMNRFKKDILNYQKKKISNMFMLFYILLIYQITNCLLLVINCQCFFNRQNILIKITANQVTAEFA